jgi:branched-chain amino acid aminotransferase
MKAMVSVNGVISRPEEAKISVFDRGFLFGDAVYETGSAFDRCCVFLEEHLARFRRSAGKLAIPVPWTDTELKANLYAVTRAFEEPSLYWRMIVSRGVVEHVGLDLLDGIQPTLVMVAQPLPNMEPLRAKGVKLLTSNVVRNSSRAQDPNIKTSNYLNSLLALQDVRVRGGGDAVLCDGAGNVTEGTTFSIFGVTPAGKLITPALSVGILDSIIRRHTLGLAEGKLSTEEGIYPLKDFQACEEVFITSSVREIIPVAEWDGKKYPTPGPKTKQLYEALKTEIHSYVTSHEKW